MNAPRGMSFMDVIVGVALVLIVFLALFGLLRASLLISSSAKAKAGATAVATTQMEYMRSLPYNSVGTVGGIPAGPVAQYATTTLNGIPYAVRTLVEYVDDAKDGSGASDSNGITTDYKRVRIATTYTFRSEEREVAIVSNIAPPSIETTVAGGTLRINVVDAGGLALAGASVRIQNPSVSPAVDFTTFSDIAGSISLLGAPTSTDYRITVSKDGYSTAVTYARDATNQNPTPGYLTVALNQTTTSTFAIDLLSTLVLKSFSPIRTATSSDTFANASGIASSASTQVAGDAILLSGAPGTYALSGTATATSTRSTYLSEWTSATANTSVPAGTTLRVQVTDGAGGLLPDSALPGNGVGFTSFPINLASVSTTTYTALALRANLTGDSLATPQVLDWRIVFKEGPIPLPNVGFTLTGAKKKGTTGSGSAIYKTIVASTTGATGVSTLPLEWDVYSLVVSGYAVVSASSSPPFTLEPAESLESILILQ